MSTVLQPVRSRLLIALVIALLPASANVTAQMDGDAGPRLMADPAIRTALEAARADEATDDRRADPAL